ncbi:helix-turn-helix domain-containing protein [Promicromonospora sp. Populi]|uniref:helix-turn-helix domain-containing protein n=1 Tax=Promicromonospora sp. Populi TaxID=3239420 RepID=UPI0034E2799C
MNREDAVAAEAMSRLDGALGPGLGAMIAAFDHVDDVFIFVKDARRVFVACSRPFLALMGMQSADELLGRRDEELSPAHLVDLYRRDDERVLATGEPIVDLVELVRNTRAGYDWFLSSKNALRDADGRIVGLVGVTRPLSPRTPTAGGVQSLGPAVEYIASEYARPIRVEDLAALVSLSASHFSRLFRRHFGVSPYRYLRRVRMIAACDLLAATELSVSEVAAQTGYYDAAHFSNDFRAEQGLSPTAYRVRLPRTQLGTRLAVVRPGSRTAE